MKETLERPIKEILHDRTEEYGGGPGAETMVFSSLAQSEFPAALKASFVGFGSVAVAVLSFGLLIACWGDIPYPGLRVACSAILTGLFFAGIGKVVLDRGELKALEESMRVESAELEQIAERLTAYRDDFDDRTSQYFHCVTTNKVQAYFVLLEIQVSLNKRVAALRALLNERSSVRTLSAVHNLLRADLKFSVAVGKNGGKERKISSYSIEAVIRELVENLEAGITLLEEQIRAAELDLEEDSFLVRSEDE